MEKTAKVNRFRSMKGFEGNGTDFVFNTLWNF